MNVAAFVVIAVILTAYVLLDGYDLGVAAIAPFVARNERQRLAAMQAIGPFWNGNEVCLIAGGGILFALFPRAYAASFSGFYLPFIVVLWLLMGRGISLELRDHYPNRMWRQFWDAIFFLSSALLVVFFGVALGNLIRGLPLDAQGYFLGTFAFLLNWYALLVAVFALGALALHGAAFLALRVDGELNQRAKMAVRRIWPVVLVLFVLVTVATFFTHPVGAVAVAFGVLAFAALLALRALARAPEAAIFGISSAFLALQMGAVAATLFPYLLPAFPQSAGAGLSIYDASSSPAALVSALGVSIAGLVAVAVYGTIVWRMLAGKVHVAE